MKRLLTPLNVAIDSVAIFAASLGWALIVWLPTILVVIFFQLRKTAPSVTGLVLVLAAFAVTFILSGVFLKWLAQGVVLRKGARTVAFSLILATQGVLEICAHFLPKQPVHPHNLLAQGVMLLMVAAVAALGLTGKAKSLKG